MSNNQSSAETEEESYYESIDKHPSNITQVDQDVSISIDRLSAETEEEPPYESIDKHQSNITQFDFTSCPAYGAVGNIDQILTRVDSLGDTDTRINC